MCRDHSRLVRVFFFFFRAEDGIRASPVTGVQTCALPIYPTLGTLRYPGAPFEMSGTPWEARNPAPTLGQHNHEVITQRLGHTTEQLAQMRAMQII